MMIENEQRMTMKFAKTTDDLHDVFMKYSGIGGMEPLIINCLSKEDNALVVYSESFDQRFSKFFIYHKIPFDEIKLNKQ